MPSQKPTPVELEEIAKTAKVLVDGVAEAFRNLAETIRPIHAVMRREKIIDRHGRLTRKGRYLLRERRRYERRNTVMMRAKRDIYPGQLLTSDDVEPIK